MIKQRLILSAGFLFLVFFLVSCSEKPSSDFSNAAWTVTWPIDDSNHAGNNCPKFFTDNLAEYGGEVAVSNPDFRGLPSGAGSVVKAKKGLVDFISLFPNTEWSIVYAYIEFTGTGEECFFRMGSDDGIRVWLNGEPGGRRPSAWEPQSGSGVFPCRIAQRKKTACS